jgi:hypothetical protein
MSGIRRNKSVYGMALTIYPDEFIAKQKSVPPLAGGFKVEGWNGPTIFRRKTPPRSPLTSPWRRGRHSQGEFRAGARRFRARATPKRRVRTVRKKTLEPAEKAGASSSGRAGLSGKSALSAQFPTRREPEVAAPATPPAAGSGAQGKSNRQDRRRIRRGLAPARALPDLRGETLARWRTPAPARSPRRRGG